MADSDLPVFSFRPNWREGVTERLGFLTDVIRGAQGNEQRRQLRPTPRRSVEADFLLSGPEKAFFDLFVNRFGGSEFMAPLYWDLVTLKAPLAVGSTRIAFDTTRREFAVGLAILMGRDALTYEVVQIEAVDPLGVDLAVANGRRWPRGTVLMPLRRMVFDDTGDLNHLSAATATATVRLLQTAPAPWTFAADAPVMHGFFPVLTDEPNWSESLQQSLDRATVRFDPGLGKLYQRDPYGRSDVAQAHRWFLKGKEALASYRDMAYRAAGRRGAIWVPTFKNDLRLVKPALAADGKIEVANIGWTYLGGPSDGRRFIAIQANGTTAIRAVTKTEVNADGNEVLSLDRSVGLALSPGQGHRISFADLGRFDSDDFEIVHFTGVDGLSEANASLRLSGRQIGSYVAVIDLPMNPMPPIDPSWGVRHGNLTLGAALEGYGGVNIELTTHPRPDVPGTPQTAPGAYPAYTMSLGYDEWVDVTDASGAVVCRYRYDPLMNQAIFVTGYRFTDLRVYPVGDRVAGNWNPSIPYRAVVRMNGEAWRFLYSITTNPDTDSSTGYGTMPFPVVDYDMHYGP